LHACGLELTVGLPKYDDSYFSLIAQQLRLDPGERVTRLAQMVAGYDPIGMLCELAKDARSVVIGRVAGALHGWPIMLGTRVLDAVPADTSAGAVEEAARQLGAEPAGEGEDSSQRWVLASGAELHVSMVPPGTRGFRDLARDAQSMRIAPGTPVSLVSLIDLIRIAESSTGPDARIFMALWATLQMRARWAKDAARETA
jgi:hypothetical protein